MASRSPSLFWRLMSAISLVLLLGAAALAYAAYNYAHRAADDAYDRLLLGAASQISETVRLSEGRVTTEIPVSAFETLSASRRERVFYRVAGPGGGLVTGYGDLALLRDANVPGPEPRVWNAEYKGFPVRAAAVWRYVSDPLLSGWTTVVVAQTREARESLARDLTLRAMLLVGIMSVIALAGSAVAIRYALRPLLKIETALGVRDPNDLTPLAMQVPAEIEELVQAINRFMERLSGRMDALQRSIADAAHQLRTPITALSAQVDLLQHEADPQRRKNQIDRVAARTSQIGRLVSQMLSHAMVSHRAESVRSQQVDLREVLTLAVSDAIPAAMPRNITVDVHTGDRAVFVTGDPLSLREAVRNVIENAVHHGARTHIAASLDIAEGSPVIEIADDGPGIPQSQWEDVKRRYVRGTSEGPGSGLGLAIAADVMQAHGGGLVFRDSGGGLFRVVLTFRRGIAS
jgi:two-component system sensor histidine kinase TctE